MSEETKNTAPEEKEAKQETKKKPVSKKNAKIEELEEKLKKAEDEVKAGEDKFLRLAAEYDNFRRRSFKEKDDIKVKSKADVVEKLLPMLDNFERAAMDSSSSLEDYKKGIDMIFRQFGDILTGLGVESFGKEGEEFDPNIHNAVMHIDDENLGENVIAQVFSTGYKIGDKVVRAAVVKVAN